MPISESLLTTLCGQASIQLAATGYQQIRNAIEGGVELRAYIRGTNFQNAD